MKKINLLFLVLGLMLVNNSKSVAGHKPVPTLPDNASLTEVVKKVNQIVYDIQHLAYRVSLLEGNSAIRGHEIVSNNGPTHPGLGGIPNRSSQ